MIHKKGSFSFVTKMIETKKKCFGGGAVNKDCFLKILKMHGFLECSVTSRRNPTAPWFGRMCLLI